MTLKNKLDILLITYNRCEELQETLNELLAENSPIKDYSIKIIDNNSTDDTYNVVQSFMQKYSNLSYAKNKYNIGGNANIMKAFYEAKNEYVWILADNDHYCWDNWSEVEKAVEDGVDAIFVSTYGCPEISIAQLYNQATFLPGVIYKTSNIDDTVMGNMAYNISNMFPHSALMAKIINQNGNIYIVKKEIVSIGDNRDKKTGKHIYTRGYDNSYMHPYLKEMSWLTGYANSILLLNNKNIRNICLTKDLFCLKFNSARVFDYNKKNGSKSLYNLLCIYCVLSPLSKVRFLINLICEKSLYKIIYFYSLCAKPNENNQIITRYYIRIFGKNKLIKEISQKRKAVDSQKYCPVLKGV